MQADEIIAHQPVMLFEVLEALNIEPNGIYVDCTFGRGGHSKEILKRLGPDGRLLVIDQDPQAVTHAQDLFANEKRIVIEQQNFSHLTELANKYDFINKTNGILFDLGVSSPQLDDAERGFSFLQEGPLDMRMNFKHGITAAEWLRQVNKNELESVIREYGQERYAKKIAKTIVNQQKLKPLETTTQLAELVQRVVGISSEKKHPATRTFQAIRIFINKELDSLAKALEECLDLLAMSGRLLVITFHSLEEQLVKNFIKKHTQSKLPRKLPVADQFRPSIKKVSKPVMPTEAEIQDNPRARSAKLYILEKI